MGEAAGLVLAVGLVRAPGLEPAVGLVRGEPPGEGEPEGEPVALGEPVAAGDEPTLGEAVLVAELGLAPEEPAPSDRGLAAGEALVPVPVPDSCVEQPLSQSGTARSPMAIELISILLIISSPLVN